MSNSKGAGLSDVIAGTTAISTVGQSGKGLSYRGYTIEDLANKACFEEVAYLLLYGELPDQKMLNNYKRKLVSLRYLPDVLKRVLELIPVTAHPMDVMRTATSVLGNLESENSFEQQRDITDRLLAIYPGVLLYWYHYSHNKKQIETHTDEDSIAAHFLTLLKGEKPKSHEIEAMDVSFILYAEHEFNASTFSARVAASTLTDIYSAITAAIGALRGPLHGGANEAAMELIKKFESLDEVEEKLGAMLARKEKIMGFGHRVYSEADPRNAIIKSWSRKLAVEVGDKLYYPVSEAIEKQMWDQKKLFPNLDFYSASTYNFMNIPVSLYTPIFVCSRITGWASHIFEQRSDNALIRPSANYNGPELRSFLPIDQRITQR